MRSLWFCSTLFVSVAVLVGIASGCSSAAEHSSSTGSGTDGADVTTESEAAAADAMSADAAADKAAACATSFGMALTNAFGRLDGTVHAVVKPKDTQCTSVNGTHLVIEVLVHGEVYRMVVNVLSDGRNGTDTRMRFAEVPHGLVGEPWSEGWHTDVSLDYPGDLDAHAQAFSPHEMDDLVERVSARLDIGDRVSIYGTSEDKPSSAHLIHRWDSTPAADDGAIVVGPDTATPTYLLFNFDGTTF